MKDLQKRWEAGQIATVLSAFKKGQAASPFGETAEGRVDLRGFAVKEPLILNAASLDGVDLSFANLSKFLCIHCNLTNWVCENSKIVLLNNNSVFDGASFTHANLSTSGSVGAAKFVNSNFKRSLLTGGVFKEGVFERCDFSEATLEKIEFGNCTISRSIFDGRIEKCFFRGALNECKFQEAAFIDCAFYGAQINNCLLSSHSLLFKDWTATFAQICQNVEAASMSEEARKSLKKWCDVWSQLKDVMREEVIDYRSLKEQEGESVADELFLLFNRMLKNVAGP